MLRFAIAFLLIVQTFSLQTNESSNANVVTKPAQPSLPENAYGGLHFMDILALRNMRNKRDTNKAAENKNSTISHQKLIEENKALREEIEREREQQAIRPLRTGAIRAAAKIAGVITMFYAAKELIKTSTKMIFSSLLLVGGIQLMKI